ncbi:MAG: hypothetical protein PVJ34_17375 [Anaerolineae bacterium]
MLRKLLPLVLLLLATAACCTGLPEPTAGYLPLPTPSEAAGPGAGCNEDLEILPLEPVVREGVEDTSDFLLSPDGRRLALAVGEAVDIVDLRDGTRRPLGVVGYARFWIDDDLLVFSTHDGAQFHYYAYDLRADRSIPLEMRWEYNDGLQSTLSEHPELLTYDQIAFLRERAGAVWSIVDVRMESPVIQGYWHKILVVSGLPEPPHHLLIHVASESHWEKYPEVDTQLFLVDGGLDVWLDTGAEFFVTRDACADGRDPYVLYRRIQLIDEVEPVGRIPYQPESWTGMVWSPDRRYIYIKQRTDGLYAISRLRLPTPLGDSD